MKIYDFTKFIGQSNAMRKKKSCAICQVAIIFLFNNKILCAMRK